MVVRGAWVILLGLLGLTTSGSAATAERVILAVPLSMQPYFIPDEGRGLLFEILMAAFDARGYRVVPLYVSQKTQRYLLKEDAKVDCVPLLSKEDSARLPAVPSSYALHDYAITLSTNGLEIEGLADLKDRNIIAYEGARKLLGPEFRSVVQGNPRYREVKNHKAQVRLLLKNRVDVIIADRLIVQWQLRRMKEQEGIDIPVTYHEIFEPLSLYFTCRDAGLIDEYAAGVEEIRRSGAFDAITDRYRR